MNKMTKLNKITKEQVSKPLIEMLQEQVRINNLPEKPYDPADNDWIKEMDARNRGEEPFQHVDKSRWNFYNREVGNPFNMRDEIIENCKNPPEPMIEELVVREKEDKIIVGIKNEYTSYSYFVISDTVSENGHNIINVRLADLGYDLYNLDSGDLDMIEKFENLLKVVETENQYFEPRDSANYQIVYKYNN